VRGDVPQRLAQLKQGKYDALIAAAAGLIRLGLQDSISHVFSLRDFPPAPGQGSLALVIRRNDLEARRLVEPVDLADTEGLPWA